MPIFLIEQKSRLVYNSFYDSLSTAYSCKTKTVYKFKNQYLEALRFYLFVCFFGLINNNILVLSSDGLPKKFRLLPFLHKTIIFWWNDANEPINYSGSSKNNIYHIVPDYRLPPATSKRQNIYSVKNLFLFKENFSQHFPPLSFVYAGSFSLAWALKRLEHYSSDQLRLIKSQSKDLALYVFNSSTTLTQSKFNSLVDSLSRFGNQDYYPLNFIIGSYLRVLVVEEILNELGPDLFSLYSFDDFTMDLPDSIRNFSKGTTSNISSIYTNSRFCFDLSGRWLTSDLICYERTLSILNNTKGLVQYKPLQGNYSSPNMHSFFFFNKASLSPCLHELKVMEYDDYLSHYFLTVSSLKKYRDRQASHLLNFSNSKQDLAAF